MQTKSQKCWFIAGLVIVLLATVFCIMQSGNRLTYLEYTTVNDQADSFYRLEEKRDTLLQEFVMPYDILHGFSVKVTTFERDNNSRWKYFVEDIETGDRLTEGRFNASLAEDNDYLLIEFDNHLALEKEKTYRFGIVAEFVSEKTSLGFYADTETENDQKLTVNTRPVSGSLCFKLYGGERDFWWTGISIFAGLVMILFLTLIFVAQRKGKKAMDSPIVVSFLVGIVFFVLLFSFSQGAIFTDELDNMRGGMIIADGGILYKDYVTQHTPLLYYICSLFALLGAGSVAQFRILYYILESVIWAGIFHRHSGVFGRKKMWLLTVMEAVFISSIIMPQGYQVLSDGIQGICMVALLLEFLTYSKDKLLDWKRSILISLCVWGNFGSVFISAYALLWVALGMLILEVKNWKEIGFGVVKMLSRYWKLLIAMLIPPIATVAYFGINGSLDRAVEQAYEFNREVYPHYLDGLGQNLMQPIVNSVQNFFGNIAEDFQALIGAQATNVMILQMLIALFATVIVIYLALKKQYLTAFVLFAAMSCSATRGYGFHGLAAWYVAIMLVALYYDELLKLIPKIGMPIACLFAVVSLSVYVQTVGDNLLQKQEAVTELEHQVISRTEEGEGILIDVYCCDSLYFMYKDRYPVNRAVYMLPWYMDWYEHEVIDDMNMKEPNIVVYNENQITWTYSDYAHAFAEELKENYERLSEQEDEMLWQDSEYQLSNQWKTMIWEKKDSTEE